MKRYKIFFLFLVMSNVLLASCVAGKQATVEPTIVAVTPSASSLPIEQATSTLQPQPTAMEEKNGTIIYDDTKNVLSYDPDTGESEVLIARNELEILLAEDKSAESYTFGYDRPIKIVLSPDLQKAYISICATLDTRFRCVFDDYIYTLKDKTAVKLPVPPDTYNVYWQWSPDSSKLAGAAWTYVEAFYEVRRFYSVNSDGTGLTTLSAITNEHKQIAWHPGNNVILPMTFVTNFRSIFIDGSQELDITLEGLEWNDKVECLSFSPDTNKVALIVRREQPKGHDWLYLARSDFSEIVPVTEFDMDSLYTCKITWAQNQNFVSLNYEYGYGAETELADRNNKYPSIDKVIDLQTSSQVEVPANTQVCGWSPNSDLIVKNMNIQGEGIDILNLSTNDSTVVSGIKELQSCPIQWTSEKLTFDIPVGISIPNACKPGSTTIDEGDTKPVPALFDIINVYSSLDGEELTATMTINMVNKDPVSYVTSGISDFLNGFDVYVDVDNNLLTGDRLGMDHLLSMVIRPNQDGTASIGSALLKFDPAKKSYEKDGSIRVSFDVNKKTITLSGLIPGISDNSRLIFLSRQIDIISNGIPHVISDRVCK